MNKKDLKLKFSEFLSNNWKNIENLKQTINRFWLKMFDVFIDWVKDYKKNPRWYWDLFNQIVLPQLKYIVDKNFWYIYFKEKNYEKYKYLFINFMEFCNENKEYINQILFSEKAKKLENSLEWLYWEDFDKKSFIKSWHKYIKEDNWENGEKFREYLTNIYWILNNNELEYLYEIFFNSYEICSQINKNNHKNKDSNDYKKKNAFDESFLNLSNNLYKININWDNLNKIKSLFWKYLNFIPYYREKLINSLKLKTDKWKILQKKIKKQLSQDLWSNTEKIQDFWIQWDWFWPIEIIESSRNWNNWIYDKIARWDIIAPLDYWIFPDSDTIWNLEIDNETNDTKKIKWKKSKKRKKKNNQTEIEF